MVKQVNESRVIFRVGRHSICKVLGGGGAQRGKSGTTTKTAKNLPIAHAGFMFNVTPTFKKDPVCDFGLGSTRKSARIFQFATRSTHGAQNTSDAHAHFFDHAAGRRSILLARAHAINRTLRYLSVAGGLNRFFCHTSCGRDSWRALFNFNNSREGSSRHQPRPQRATSLPRPSFDQR